MPKKQRRRSSPSRNVVAEARAGGPPRGTKWWETFKSLAATIAIFLLLRTFLVEAYRIPSPSMVPAMLPGDWLFVDKLRYGPHIPFTSWNLPGYASPRRWDIIVFKSPLQVDQPWDPTPTVVKRVVGMPGDTIYSRRGVVHINGVAQRQGYRADLRDTTVGDAASPLFGWQRGIEVKGTRFGEPPARPTLDHWGPLIIPPASYFMMGDNRYESKDSRFYGTVPRENFRGRPLFVYFAYDPDCERPLCFLTAIRGRRIGDVVR